MDEGEHLSRFLFKATFIMPESHSYFKYYPFNNDLNMILSFNPILMNSDNRQ